MSGASFWRYRTRKTSGSGHRSSRMWQVGFAHMGLFPEELQVVDLAIELACKAARLVVTSQSISHWLIFLFGFF